MMFDYVLVNMTPTVEVDQNVGLGRALERRGHRVAYVAPTRGIEHRLRRKGMANVHRVGEFLHGPHGRAADYGLPSLRSLYLPELFTLDIREDQRVLTEMAGAYLGAVERFFAAHDVGCVVFGRGPKLLTRSFYYVARSKKTPVVIIDKSPIAGLLGLYGNEEGRWERLDSEHPWTVSDDERALARAFIDEWRERRPVFPQWGVSSKDVRVRLKTAAWVARYGSRDAFPDNFDRRLALYRFLKRRIVRAVNTAAKPRLYGDLPTGDFVYLPMQYENETTLTIWARPYKRQQYLADLVARSLPEGITLGVRPHPDHVGAYSPSMLRAIRRIPNATLIDPAVHPHDVLSSCRAVVVTAGTSGFEALLYTKPVVTMGSAFYRGFGLTHDVTDPSELEAVVAHALHAPPDPSSVVDFVAAVRRCSYEGSYQAPEVLAASIERKRAELAGLASP